ncbi:FAD-binding oxidoreductase [Actinomycetospora sp. TBRC 11914]|uniref:FAD-binding oxidoreductase n=1 Tax=Actinomycetospora sp. TBRC 11914 TaxID=2729387 RepID=UPI00145DCD7E|nr:FAD-binding oxidoreductase [Actinomycetospora sp. TBRC 11914]NMO91381.1 FAD-binding oxidoreductase [Actinomycetospora sp. TBRC 11914]
MTQVISRVDDLRAALTGSVVTPDDPGYDEARQVWNGDIDRRPAVIAYCATAEDVAAAVTFARDASLEISVRSGGAHSTAGLSVGDAGIVIDLGRLSEITVDPARRRATVGGGALQRDIDAATQAHGLAVPLGEIGHTGVGGIATGGGMGWLTRQHGLTCDNVLSAQVVLADGRIVRAAPDENPDLYWAIRGGGGNFGVVTSFEFALHEVGPEVDVGMFFYGMDRAADALRLAREVIPDLPPDVSFEVVGLSAPPAPFVPEEHHSRLVLALAAVGFGAEPHHRELLERLRAALPPLFEMVSPMPYAALQQMFDDAFPRGTHCYEKALYLEEFTDAAIDVAVERITATVSPMSCTFFYVLSGAYGASAEEDTAFGGGRTPRMQVFILGMTPEADGLTAERAWVRGFYDALAPHAMGKGGYVNGILPDDVHRLPATYGTKYPRLARIKAAYDPDNLFHRNANIPPAP